MIDSQSMLYKNNFLNISLKKVKYGYKEAFFFFLCSKS